MGCNLRVDLKKDRVSEYAARNYILDKYLTHERILVLEKLLGIFLAALAVQLMVDGLVDLRIIAAIVH